MWGFSIEAELVENKDKQDELCCYVSRVEERSVASSNGKEGKYRYCNKFLRKTCLNLVFIDTHLIQRMYSKLHSF